MRTYHRWLSVLFGLFILFIAVTGVLSQGARLYASTEPRPAAVSEAAAKLPEAPRPAQTHLQRPALPQRSWFLETA